MSMDARGNLNWHFSRLMKAKYGEDGPSYKYARRNGSQKHARRLEGMSGDEIYANLRASYLSKDRWG